MYVGCQQDEFFMGEDKELINENVYKLKTTLNVINQNQANQKFGLKSNLNSYFNSNLVKAKGAYDNYIIDTDYINSFEAENFHSLTYLVTYPENPELYVNLILFSNDYEHYHPVIYKYNLSPDQITRDIIINKDQMIPIKVENGQNYLDALAKIPTTSNIGTNDPCVKIYEKEIPHKCKANAHLPGDDSCNYIGGQGEAYNTYVLVIDVSDCGESGGGPGGGGPGGGGPGGGGPGGGGYIGIDDPGNPINSNPIYEYPWLGGPGGGWQPTEPVITLPNLPLPGRINMSFFKNGLNSEQLEWWNVNEETPEKTEIYDFIYKGGDKEVAYRYIDLLIDLQNDLTKLVEIDCNELPKWSNLVNHNNNIPISVINKLNNLNNIYIGNYGIQYICGAKGTVVNLDYFSIRINSLPVKPNSILKYTPQEYLEHIRLNLNDYIDTNNSSFSPSVITPYNESQIWNSNNPLGAIIHINIPGPTGDGSVICSRYNMGQSWVFTTIETPFQWGQGFDGQHPVSGHREFGLIQNSDGTYVFYTRGVDRIQRFIHNVGSTIMANQTFQKPDALWTSLVNKVKLHVDNNLGQSAGSPIIIKNRPDWDKVKEVLLGIRPKSDLGCN